MIILRLVQFSFFAILIIGVVTQLMVPAIKGTRLFPILSDRRSKAKSKAVESNEDDDIRRIGGNVK